MTDWPFLFEFARKHQGEPLALATLVAREGSSYRQPGARMLIAGDGSYQGSLSGGCLEEGVARTAGQVIGSGEIRRVVIDTRPHFGCPGKLHIQIEGIRSEFLNRIEEELKQRRTVFLVTDSGGTRIAKEEFSELMEQVEPPPRLILVGWTSDAEPVLKFARDLGWECHRVLRDPRMIYETPQVAGETIQVLGAANLVGAFKPDPFTAVLVMTHHLATDLAFLKAVLPAGYGYVGLLGSKRRRETLLGELGEFGLLEDPGITRCLHAPVGLDLGGNHPTSIALAIVAEIHAVFSGGKGGFLHAKSGPIHTMPVAS